MEFKINAKTLFTTIALSSGLVFANYTSVMSTENRDVAEDAVGTIVMWGKGSIPKDWIEVDGRSTAGNAELMSLYGSTIPDLRGKFVRGYGDNSGALGDIQEESMRAHSHTATFTGNALPAHKHTGTTLANNTESHGNKSNDAANNSHSVRNINGASGGKPTGSVSVGATGGTEVRPINTALVFIMKEK